MRGDHIYVFEHSTDGEDGAESASESFAIASSADEGLAEVARDELGFKRSLSAYDEI